MNRSADILIVTVNRTETKAVLEAFAKGVGQKATVFNQGNQTYYDLGVLNGLCVVLVQSEMGSIGLGATLQTVEKSVATLNPQGVIMVGVAFGMRPDKQQIGQVLVAKRIMSYESQRVGSSPDGLEEVIPRGVRTDTTVKLLQHLQAADVTREKADPKVSFGLLVSGEKLVDNVKLREKIRSFEPEAIGGEMEGAGLYAACQSAKVDWILVKSICDWADGNKGADKDMRQALAANNAASFTVQALQIGQLVTPNQHRETSRRTRPNNAGNKTKNNSVHSAKPPAFLATNNSSLNQLPPLPAQFTGRGDALAKLEGDLTAEYAVGAVISGVTTNLQGAPGVGKTALATVLAHRVKGRFPDAQLYLNLRGAGADIFGKHPGAATKPVSPVEAMQIIIHAFHPEIKLPETEEVLSSYYRSVLARAGRVLLFLDNVADADQVRPLLPPPNCLLLATSRQQLNLHELAEHHLDYLSPKESQELLLKLAPRLKGCERDAANLCGNLPLALKAVAGMVKTQSIVKPLEILARIRGKHEKLTSVDAAFQVSYEFLPGDIRNQWVLLSVFPSSFDLTAAAAVWNEREAGAMVRATLQTLVNASLVEYNTSNGRFRLHDLVRQFCDGKLNGPERTAAWRRYVGHYRDLSTMAKQLYKKGGEYILLGLEFFDLERTHIETAFDWLQSQNDEESAGLLVSLVTAVAYTSDLRFHPKQLILWLKAKVKASKIIKDRQAEGIALGNLGIAYWNLGDSKNAVIFHEQSLAIAREIGDRRGESSALGNLGNICKRSGKLGPAIDAYNQSLVIAQEIGNRRSEGLALSNLGSVYCSAGNIPKAIDFFTQGLVIHREIGDWRAEAIGLGNLGSAYAEIGEYHKAIELFQQGLTIHCEIGDRRGEATILGNLGSAYKGMGDTPKAMEFYSKQLKIVREIGDRRGEGYALWNFTLALEKLGERAKAITHAEAALNIYDATENAFAAQIRETLSKWRANSPASY